MATNRIPIPSDCLSGAASYLSPKDLARFSSVNRDCRKIAQQTINHYDWAVLQSASEKSLLGKLKCKNLPAGREKEECIRTILQQALQYLNDRLHFLEPDDWQELRVGESIPSRHRFSFLRFFQTRKIHPTLLDLSLTQLNRAADLIEQHLEHLALETIFHKIFEQILLGQRPRIEGSLRQRAMRIQASMEDHRAMLHAITHLDLSNLNLTHCPGLSQLTQLQHLDLSRNPISQLPDTFNPPHLIWFALVHTKITHLPESFNPPKLRWLAVVDSQLEQLPEHFNPPQLWGLGMGHGKIKRLPDHFSPPQLQWLCLYNTELECLPHDFNLPELRWLFLKKTKMKHLPDRFDPPKLRELDLQETDIEQLPRNFNRRGLAVVKMSRRSPHVRNTNWCRWILDQGAFWARRAGRHAKKTLNWIRSQPFTSATLTTPASAARLSYRPM